MSLELYGLFVLASVLLVATPGPNVALIVGTSLRYGLRAGLMTVAGVNLGLALQMSAIALGLAWLVDLFARHFDLIRYAGAAYLAVLGLQQLLARRAETADLPPLRGERAFAQGLAVAFGNPKTLIFHAAFLPQFVSGESGSGGVLWLLVATYCVISGVGDGLWGLFAARARAAVSGRAQRIADRASGAILLGGAAVLLAAGRR
ncbi:MAG: LysE family translocator [Variibacter sp.]|nr:LysE family translocator [Variibacter sp.]